MATSVNVIMTKPVILVYCTVPVEQGSIDNLFYGIEEEGIPFEVHDVAGQDACQAAHAASVESALSVGVGCDGRDMYIHYKNLPENLFLFKLSNYSQHPLGLRVLGVNAARLAKGEPFRLDHDLETSF